MIAKSTVAAFSILPSLLALFSGCIQEETTLSPPSSAEVPTDFLVLQGNASMVRPMHARFLDSGYDWSEPTLGITSKGVFFVCCTLQNGQVITLRSADAGTTWAPAHSQILGTSDPMLAVDPITDRVYELNMLNTECSNLAFSDDQGASWTERPLSCTVPRYDFLKLAAGRPGPDSNPLAGNAYPSVLYQCRNVNAFVRQIGIYRLSNWCAVSYDGGLTWPIDEQVASEGLGSIEPSECAGVTSFPVVGPDGTAVLPLGGKCRMFSLAISRDSGRTWRVIQVPGERGLFAATPQAAFDGSGNLYVLWRNQKSSMLLARTDDLGLSWFGPWDVTPPEARTTMFESLKAGGDGHLAAAFFGTNESADGASEVSPQAHWHLYMVAGDLSDAENPTLAVMKATAGTAPVQVGPICLGAGSKCPRNHGDFFTGAVSPDGHFHVAFTNACLRICPGDQSNLAQSTSKDRRGQVAVLEGWQLK